jgi:hypothetical protein
MIPDELTEACEVVEGKILSELNAMFGGKLERMETFAAIIECEMRPLFEEAEETTLQQSHNDLSRCLQEGKDPVLLLAVWRDVIAKYAEARKCGTS